MLGRLDTATMQASLEAQVPYTDHQLVVFAFGLPSHFRIDVDPLEATPYLAVAELERCRTLRPKRLLLLGRCRQSWLNDVKRFSLRRLKDGYPAVATWAQSRLLNSPFGHHAFRRETMAELASNVTAAGMWL